MTTPTPPARHHVRLATASPSSDPAGLASTLDRLAALTRRAAALHADLLLLPEAYLGGYPRGSGFGTVVGERTAAGREEFRRYFKGAVDLGDIVGEGGAGGGDKWLRREFPLGGAHDGEDGVAAVRGDGTREELEKLSRDTGVFLVVGVIERAGGSLYCAVVYVDPAKGIIGKRRKVMPTASERLIWAQGGAATLRAVSTTIRGIRINLAAAICWESYMPLVRQALYAQNVNLYLAPTADARDAWLSLMRTVGCEGRCFVVSSNMAVRKTGASESTAVSDPLPANRGSWLPQHGHRRRKSIAVEDGHEIVLCCDEEGDGKQASETPVQGQDKGASGHLSAAAASTDSGQAEWSSRGGSCIVGPLGDVLVGPQWEDDQGIIWADVDFEDCVRGRLDLDAAGSYSRNDSFKFSVEGLDLEPLPYY
ncbi:hypothetical protein ACRALDRAFT_2041722 [Sodiomyces alcalophilus JCM 7366]|uniref:uncharacterized protein n=1 Tax=Sodiomyces alcalophilus JCM 7366 TaxID=591952 RepID=UPI0039B60384